MLRLRLNQLRLSCLGVGSDGSSWVGRTAPAAVQAMSVCEVTVKSNEPQ